MPVTDANYASIADSMWPFAMWRRHAGAGFALSTLHVVHLPWRLDVFVCPTMITETHCDSKRSVWIL